MAALPPRGLVHVIPPMGHYMMAARLLATLNVELDPAPNAWATEH